MKKYFQILSLFSFLLFIVSCNGQIKSDLPKENPETKTDNSKSESAENSLPKNDFDPYFTESRENTSAFGPNSITRNIMQDKNGKFWFATWLGIIGYDPSNSESIFTNYTNKEDLRRHRVFSLLEDQSGILWFGTIGAGVYRYDGNVFTNITAKDGLVHDDIGCIYQDSKGDIWFGTRVGISRYDGKTFQNFTTADGLSDNDVNSIIEDKNGRIWIGTRGEACFYENGVFHTFANFEGSTFVNVRCIIADKKGNIWLGGNAGLWRCDLSDQEKEQYIGQPSQPIRLINFTNYSKPFVGYIYEDKKGNIWTSSEADEQSRQWAITRYVLPDGQTRMQNEKAIATQILVKEDMFFGITEDTKGNIWFGSLNGVCRYDGNAFNYFNAEMDKE